MLTRILDARRGKGPLARFAGLVLLAVLCVVWVSPAAAKKVALIIGNGNYSSTVSLKNPANDAALVGNAARNAGFDVTMASDLNLANFQRALRDFRSSADGAEVAMIYYSGHGIEGQGKNWLIPTDSKLETDFDLPYEAINMDRLLEALAGAQVRVVVLDACRNNPFGSAWKAGIRAVPQGLNGTEYDDVMVIFAAAPGQTATDGTGTNSPFATSLAKRLPEPGLALQMLGGAVRDDVLAATGGKQRPFVSASITGTPIFLVGKTASSPAAPAPAAIAADSGGASDRSAGGGDRSALDALMWQGAVSSNTLGGYQAYLREFPAGLFSNIAKQNIAKMQGGAPQGAGSGTGVASAPVVIPSAPAPAPASLVTASASPASGTASPASLPAAVTPAPVAPAPVAIVTPSASAPAGAGTAVTTAVATATPAATPATGAPGFVSTPAASDAGGSGWGRSGLPALPAGPQFAKGDYPGCREAYQAVTATPDKVEALNKCTLALDKYYGATLVPYRQKMADHQKAISAMYTEQVGGQMQFSSAQQGQFYKAMMKEHAESNPDGVHFAEWRAVEAEYNKDRAYLQDRYCFITGCAGYTAQPYVAPAPPPAAVVPPRK